MKVGLLVYGLDRPLTGIGRYTLELARALARVGSPLQLTLLTAGRPSALAQASHYQQIPLPGCRLLPGLMTLGNVLVARASRRRQLNIVHDPTGVSPFLFGAGGARIVVTIHDVFAWAFPGTNRFLDTLIYRHWLPHRLPGVEAVITDSQSSKADIVYYLRVPATKVHVIPLAISPVFQPARAIAVKDVLARYGLSAGYILFVGSQGKRRNLLRLLQAYDLLRQNGEQRPLVIVGAGWLGKSSIALKRQALRVNEQIIFLGHVLESDLPALYSGAELFVFPSLYEGFGLPPLEAMACGTPVVCSNAASLPEVVGEAALTVEPHNVEALAEAMESVLRDNGLRETLRQKGLKHAAQFTWERTAKETEQVYHQVLAE